MKTVLFIMLLFLSCIEVVLQYACEHHTHTHKLESINIIFQSEK